MSTSLVTINLVVLNGEKYIRHCLDAVLAQTYPRENMEINILDNNSTDGSVEIIEKRFPWARICRSDNNGSFASAINRGIRASSGKYILCLDSDAVIQDNTVPELVNFLEAHP